MARYHWFRDEYANLARSWQDFGSPRGTQWFGLSMLRRATDLRRRSAALDTLDDVVANTATFLNQDRGWEQAWYNEQGPLLEDLQALLTLCQKIDSSGRLPVNTMGTREKVRWFHERLYHMTMDLSAGRLQPSQALDELDVRLVHLPEELTSVGGQGLHVAALPLGEDRVEGQGGLARARQSGEDDHRVARQVQVDALEIVLAGPTDDERVVHGIRV